VVGRRVVEAKLVPDEARVAREVVICLVKAVGECRVANPPPVDVDRVCAEAHLAQRRAGTCSGGAALAKSGVLVAIRTEDRPLPLKNNLVAIGALVRAFLTVVGEPEPHLARGLGSPRPISGRWSAASSIEEARPVVDTHDRQWVEPARCDRG